MFESYELTSGSCEAASTELTPARQRLELLAETDPLTGLFSLSAFQNCLRTLFEEERESIGLVLLDVDHLKQFNLAHGYPCGDQALQGIANSVKGAIRQNDLAARYSGEEFAVIVPDADEKEAMVIAERIRRIVELQPWNDHLVTVSAGVACSHYGRPDMATLIEKADKALNVAKNQGRNRIVHASSLLDAA